VIGKTLDRSNGVAAMNTIAPDYDRAFAGETVGFEREFTDATGARAGSAAAWCRTTGSTARSRASTSSATTSPISRSRRNSLAARESQLRSIMDGVPAPVAYIDRDERCQYVNRAFLQYFGSDRRGSRLAAAARRRRPRHLRGRAGDHDAHLRRRVGAFDRLVPARTAISRWMTIRIVPDATPSGDVPGAFVLMNDIHGLKQAQEALRASESELRLIMDNVPARVAYIDRDYHYRFLNRHNEEWLG
jgi:PAS domain S-box-containing protein